MLPSLAFGLTQAALKCPGGSSASLTACRAPSTTKTPVAGAGHCCSCPFGSYSTDGTTCRRCVSGQLALDGVDLSQTGTQCLCLPGFGDYDPVAMSCRRCPINFYSSNSKCLPCAAETFAAAQSTQCAPVRCPWNSYLAPGGATVADCTQCKFGTSGQACGTVQGCRCLPGYAAFDKNSGTCSQCEHSNSISTFADMTKPDTSATVCTDCPAGTIASVDRRTCVPKAQGTSTFPTTAIPKCTCAITPVLGAVDVAAGCATTGADGSCTEYKTTCAPGYHVSSGAAFVKWTCDATTHLWSTKDGCTQDSCFVDTETTFALDTPQLQSRVMNSARSPTFINQSNTFNMQFERRLVDDADRLCPLTGDETGDEICSLSLRRVQLLHLRPGDFIFTHRATGAPELKYMQYLAHPIDELKESVDITTLYYRGADGSLQSISLTDDHMLATVSGSEESLPRLPTESEFLSAPVSDRDLIGDSGPLSSMWVPGNNKLSNQYLRAAAKIVPGDYIWHQPLPGSGASVSETGEVRVPMPMLVRIERVETEVKFNVTLQIPVASSFQYSVSGVVANFNSVPTAAFFSRIRLAAPTVWMMQHWPEFGHRLFDSVVFAWGVSEAWATECIFRARDEQGNRAVTVKGFTMCSWRHAAASHFAQWISDSMMTFIVAAFLSIGAASFIRQKASNGNIVVAPVRS